MGAERGECYPNGTCDEGLTCLSNRCVDWPPDGAAAADARPGTETGAPNDTSSNDSSPPDDTPPSDVVSGDGGSAPSRPTNLSLNLKSDQKIELSWMDASQNERTFVIERRDSVQTTNFTKIDQVSANTTAYVDASVLLGLEYEYRVRARNRGGISKPSNVESLETPVPTLQDDIAPIFNKSCGAGSTGCHAKNVYAATEDRDCRGWLSLENRPLGKWIYDKNGNKKKKSGCPNRDLHYRLTEIRAWQCDPNITRKGTVDYVVPGKLMESYLWRKIEGIQLCQVGGDQSKQMPLAGSLDPDDRILIRQWILKGAPEK